MPNSRFIHAAVSDRNANNPAIFINDKGNYVKQNANVVDFVELLKNENRGRLVDYLSIDAEGAEFALLPLLHCEF